MQLKKKDIRDAFQIKNKMHQDEAELFYNSNSSNCEVPRDCHLQ